MKRILTVLTRREIHQQAPYPRDRQEEVGGSMVTRTQEIHQQETQTGGERRALDVL